MNSSGANVFIMLIFFISPFFACEHPTGFSIVWMQKIEESKPVCLYVIELSPWKSKKAIGNKHHMWWTMSLPKDYTY